MTSLNLAAVNPPRKAKRPLPVEFVENSSDGDLTIDDDNRDNGPTPTSPKRRRASSAASRSAREQARRQNHSRIEKRRRIKINDALSELRALVSSPAATAAIMSVSPEMLAAEKDANKDKEFKLEVLEKTVAYMKYLVRRVGEFEGTPTHAHVPPLPKPAPIKAPTPTSPLSLDQPMGTCRTSSASDSPSPLAHPLASPATGIMSIADASPAFPSAFEDGEKRSSLPSISSWIDTVMTFHPPPSRSSASVSPSLGPNNPKVGNGQLLSPPISNRIRPEEIKAPPRMMLPPSHAGKVASPSSSSDKGGVGSGVVSKKASRKGSKDDVEMEVDSEKGGDALERDAASTLVQISRRASLSRVSTTGSPTTAVAPAPAGMDVQIQTPSSILGLL